MNYLLILIFFILLLIKTEIDMLNTNNKEVYGLLKIIFFSLILLSVFWIYLLGIFIKNQRNNENQQKITDFYHNVRGKNGEIN